MKKLTVFVLTLVCILGLVGCKEPNKTDAVQTTAATVAEGPLDGGADITPDAEIEATDDTTVPEIMNGTLDGGADIAIDAQP